MRIKESSKSGILDGFDSRQAQRKIMKKNSLKKETILDHQNTKKKKVNSWIITL